MRSLLDQYLTLRVLGLDPQGCREATMSLITAENVRKDYQAGEVSVRALKGISFAIEPDRSFRSSAVRERQDHAAEPHRCLDARQAES